MQYLVHFSGGSTIRVEANSVEEARHKAALYVTKEQLKYSQHAHNPVNQYKALAGNKRRIDSVRHE